MYCIDVTVFQLQVTVDKSDVFVDVLIRVEKWLENHALGTEKTFAVLTDG